MTHDLICSWLDLPAGCWPPDHYTLLGLPPGETDPALIEQHVHERMDRVRRYQLSKPEAATEAMNRLAQALVCLNDPTAKRAYDTALLPAGAVVAEPQVVPAVPVPEGTGLSWVFGNWTPTPPAPPAENGTQLDWQTAPPPPRTTPVGDTAPSNPTLSETVPPPAAPTVPPPEPPDPLAVAARSAEARRGLATKRAFYYRVVRTRRLLQAWEAAGKYLASVSWSPARPAEATDMMYQMQAIRELLRTFPPLLGETGQPGHYVLTLARQQAVVPALQLYNEHQRELLARDWKHGRDLLRHHRGFLRQQLQAMRRQSRFRRQVRAVRDFFWDHIGMVLVLLAGLSLLGLALDPDMERRWKVLYVAAGLGLVALSLCGFAWGSTPRRMPRALPPPPTQRARPRRRVQRQPN
jgi:hypothetical protein